MLSADHADFPTLLAEALDLLAAVAYDLPKTATLLGTTRSQLIKLFQMEPAVLAGINRLRAAQGKRPLK